MNIVKRDSYNDFISSVYPELMGEGRYVRNVTFQVTEDCNLRCSYCYQTHKSKNVMTFDVGKKFINLLLNAKEGEYISLSNSPAIVLDFIGGEPLLEVELIDRLIDYFMEQAILKHHPWATMFRVSMSTNGMNYFEPNVQKFLKKHLEYLSLSISIDGNKELHDSCRITPDGSGSYDIAIKGVEHYTNVFKRTIGSKMTIAPQNVNYLFEAVVNLIRLGYKIINLNCIFEKGWTSEHATTLYFQLKQLSDYVLENSIEAFISMFNENFFTPQNPLDNNNWCGGTGHMLAVDYTGNIYPCIRYSPTSLGSIPPLVIGNVDEGVCISPDHQNCVHCLKAITRRSQSTDECFNCPISTGCAWCSAYNYQETRNPDKRVTYTCIMHKARALANVYFWNKYYIKHDIKGAFINHVPDDWALEIIDNEELKNLKSLEKRTDNNV